MIRPRHIYQEVKAENDFIKNNLEGFSILTEREKNIISLVARGYSKSMIACELRIKPESVKKYLRNVYRKLHLHKDYELKRFAAIFRI